MVDLMGEFAWGILGYKGPEDNIDIYIYIFIIISSIIIMMINYICVHICIYIDTYTCVCVTYGLTFW